MAEISLTFPDGSPHSFPAGITAAEVAGSISTSLGKKAISATVDGRTGTCNGRSRPMPPSRSTR
jgi:threonyl-tRNA synthetase